MRLKKLLKKEGKIVVVDESGKDAYIMQTLEDYEDGLCGCDCCDDEDIDVFGDDDWDNDINDEELMKKVNEDIAKWREEKKADEVLPVEKEEKKEEPQLKEDEALSEEEKYYLEPLE